VVINRCTAIVLRNLGYYDQALELFLENLEADKSNGGLHHNISVTYAQLNNLPKSFFHIKKALDLTLNIEKIDHLQYVTSYAHICMQASNFDEGLNIIENALKKFQNPPILLLTRLCAIALQNPSIFKPHYNNLKDKVYNVVLDGTKIKDNTLSNIKHLSVITIVQSLQIKRFLNGDFIFTAPTYNLNRIDLKIP